MIKYRDVQFQANAIMLLLLISAAMAVAPLGLQYMLKPKSQPPKEATIYLSGELKDSSDSAAKLADTPLKATNVITNESRDTRTDQEGHFDFEPLRITPEANRIKLLIRRDGYSPFEKTIVADEQNIAITLSKVHE